MNETQETLEDGTVVTVKEGVIEIPQPLPDPIKEDKDSLERKKHFLQFDVQRGLDAQDEIKQIDELLGLIR